jgi:GTP diphosphokinase / guanosine-3',5'-bis(diphosphate) 3'-diphosphatase
MPKAVEEVLIPKRPPSKKEKMSQGIRVKGIDNVLVRFSKCCSPVPGDDIIGYITLGKGISIHRRNCTNMPALAMQTERVVEVSWEDKQKGIRYQVEIELEAWDRAGLLSDVMSVVNETKIPTISCNAKVKKSKAIITLAVEILDKLQLDDLIKRLARVRDVISVGRSTSQGDYI